MDPILQNLAAIARRTTDRADRARGAAETMRAARNYRWVGIYDVTVTEIVAIAWTGSTPPTFPRFSITQGLNGAAVQTREEILVQDVASDPRYLTTFGSTRAEAIFPITSFADGRVIGTIDVESDRTHAFTPGDQEFLRKCAETLRPFWSEAHDEKESNARG